MRIIPAIDLKDGKCVRLFQGDFEQTTEYSSNPVEIGMRFSSLDVDDLHIVDLNGARDGTQSNAAIVSEIGNRTGLTVQLGGGIRTRENIVRWLGSGVQRCVVGSIAIQSPATVNDWIDEFGADRIVIALDVKLDAAGLPLLTTHGWRRETGSNLWDCLDAHENAKHILCTDVGRDGAMTGPNLELYREILRRYPDLELQASGGVRHVDDLRALNTLGCPAAITGRALLEGKISAAEAGAFRQSA